MAANKTTHPKVAHGSVAPAVRLLFQKGLAVGLLESFEQSNLIFLTGFSASETQHFDEDLA